MEANIKDLDDGNTDKRQLLTDINALADSQQGMSFGLCLLNDELRRIPAEDKKAISNQYSKSLIMIRQKIDMERRAEELEILVVAAGGGIQRRSRENNG